MKKGRVIAGAVFGTLSIACFVFATAFLFSAIAEANASGDAGQGIALIVVIPIALMVYGGQLFTGVISLLCMAGGLKSESRPIRIVAWIFLVAVVALFVVAIALITYLLLRQ